MKRIKIIRKGIETNKAELPDAEADAWLASCLAKNKFGLPARPELDAQGNPTGVTLPAEYTIVEEDMTAEVMAQKAKDDARKAALDAVKGADMSKVTTLPEMRDMLQKIVVALGLK